MSNETERMADLIALGRMGEKPVQNLQSVPLVHVKELHLRYAQVRFDIFISLSGEESASCLLHRLLIKVQVIKVVIRQEDLTRDLCEDILGTEVLVLDILKDVSKMCVELAGQEGFAISLSPHNPTSNDPKHFIF